MKIKPIVTLFSLCFGIISCINLSPEKLPDYPSYRDIIVKFLNEYSISEIEYPNQFSLAKKPDGWHAIIVDVVAEETIQDDLYWARKLKRFMEVHFPPAIKTALDPGYKSMIEDWRNNHFSGILPYWGYAGWDKDIIDEYGNKKNLSDTLLNALARAYTSYARNLLSPGNELALKEIRFDLPDGQNALSEEQLAMFREYEHKGLDTYYRLWELNPDFETFVADIYTVYSNEVMNSYLTIGFYQNHDEAQAELKDDLYDPFIIDMAKRFLASCDQNAILLTNGDTDTYPLHYVQEKEGFRQDVSVVNVSLLSDGRYVSYLRQAFPGRDPVPFRMPDEFYWDNSLGYFPIVDQVKSSDIIEAINFIASDDPRTKIRMSLKDIDYLPTKNLVMKVDVNNLPAGYNASGQDNKIRIKLAGNYLMLNHLCMLDMISTNNFIRPVYYAITVQHDNYFGLEEYLQREGMAYKITAEMNSVPRNEFYTGYTNTGVQYKKLMEESAFHIPEDAAKYYEFHQRMIRNYRMIYSSLALELIDEDKNDMALNVLNYCSEEFPQEKTEYGFQSIDLIEAWYRIDQIDKANDIVETMFQSCKDFLEEKNTENFNVNDYDTRLKLTILQSLSSLTSQYIRESELSQEIEERFMFYYQKIKQY